MATSQLWRAAAASRAASSALCTPRRRWAVAVAAPHSCANQAARVGQVPPEQREDPLAIRGRDVDGCVYSHG